MWHVFDFQIFLNVCFYGFLGLIFHFPVKFSLQAVLNFAEEIAEADPDLIDVDVTSSAFSEVFYLDSLNFLSISPSF